MKGSLPFRMAHWTMVVLTLANLLWISGPSCCCASSNGCSQASAEGKVNCCSPKSDDAGCSCCCKKADASQTESGCKHCGKNSNQGEHSATFLSRSERTTLPCGTSSSCNCGEVSSRPTAPVTRTTQTVQDHSDAAPLAIALIEPKWPEIRPALSVERQNHLLAALDRPVSIRFGVWRN